MLLNMKIEVVGIDGKSLKDQEGKALLLNEIVANVIGMSPKLGSIKFFDIAQKLFRDGTIELDDSDSKKLYDFIDTNEQLFMPPKAQALKIIDRARLESKPK